MPRYTFYSKLSGEIVCTKSLANDVEAIQNTGNNEAWVEGDIPRDHKIVDGEPIKKSDAEIEEGEINISWVDLRIKRNAMLKESDWTQVPDAPVDAAVWATYRQALRDLPANTDDPRYPTWPTPPT